MLKAVVFDMDNTLFDLRRASASAADVVSLLAGKDFDLHFLPLNSHNTRRVRLSLSMYLGIGDAFDENPEIDTYLWLYRALEQACICEFDRMREVLDELKKAGLRLAVLSNTDGDGVRKRLAELDYLKYFEVVICRGEAPALKPNAAAFHAVLEALGVEPHEAAMVGDRLDNDVYGARVAGMRAIHAWYGSTGERSWVDCAETPVDILRFLLQQPTSLALKFNPALKINELH